MSGTSPSGAPVAGLMLVILPSTVADALPAAEPMPAIYPMPARRAAIQAVHGHGFFLACIFFLSAASSSSTVRSSVARDVLPVVDDALGLAGPGLAAPGLGDAPALRLSCSS